MWITLVAFRLRLRAHHNPDCGRLCRLGECAAGAIAPSLRCSLHYHLNPVVEIAVLLDGSDQPWGPRISHHLASYRRTKDANVASAYSDPATKPLELLWPGPGRRCALIVNVYDELWLAMVCGRCTNTPFEDRSLKDSNPVDKVSQCPQGSNHRGTLCHTQDLIQCLVPSQF